MTRELKGVSDPKKMAIFPESARLAEVISPAPRGVFGQTNVI